MATNGGARVGQRARAAALRALVVGDGESTATSSDIIEAGLAGYAVANAESLGVTVDDRLAAARVTLAARHMVSKLAFTTLVRAWTDAGLEVLVFKGFALAELAYPDPTWRPYSDIDLALRPPADGDWRGLAKVAAKLAADAGFTVMGRPELSGTFDSLYGASYRGPALLQLAEPRNHVSIDVHSRLVHNNHLEGGNVAKQVAMTQAVWRDSHAVTLAGLPVRIPSPVDSALIGLIVGRTWSTDASHLRPHDYLDMQTLYGQGVTRSALEARSRELGCSRTTRLFLSRCDPATRTLDLRAPNALTRVFYDTLHAPEHGHRTLDVRLIEARHLPARTLNTAAQLPNVTLHLLTWRNGAPQRWPAEYLPDGDAELDRDGWHMTQFAVRRAFQLYGLRWPERRPEVAAAALLYALRKRGVPAHRRAVAAERQAGDGSQWELVLDGEVLRPSVLGLSG